MHGLFFKKNAFFKKIMNIRFVCTEKELNMTKA